MYTKIDVMEVMQMLVEGKSIKNIYFKKYDGSLDKADDYKFSMDSLKEKEFYQFQEVVENVEGTK